jgi:hypothetical protein
MATENSSYVLDIITGVRCDLYASPEEARQWIVSYGVTQQYKDEHYRIVNHDEYWERLGKGKHWRP